MKMIIFEKKNTTVPARQDLGRLYFNMPTSQIIVVNIFLPCGIKMHRTVHCVRYSAYIVLLFFCILTVFTPAATVVSSSITSGLPIHTPHDFPRVDVFTKGENGYYCIKIPSLLSIGNTLIAFGEGRLGSCSDFTETHIVYKRSFNGGLNWTTLTVLYSENNTVIGNASPVFDTVTQEIILVFCRNNSQVFITFSSDTGAAWTTPRMLPNVTQTNWTWIGTGPPSSIQIHHSSSPYNNRIVVPAYHSYTAGDDGELSAVHMMYSDDHGLTWNIQPHELSYNVHFPNENQILQFNQTVNSSSSIPVLYVNARGLLTSRIGGYSYDGGYSWTNVHEISGLDQPLGGCEGSTYLLPDQNIIVYTGLSETSVYRYNLTLWWLNTSDIANGSFQPLMILDTGPSAYSSIAAPLLSLNNQTNPVSYDIGILYERSNRTLLIFEPDAISMIRVPYSSLPPE